MKTGASMYSVWDGSEALPSYIRRMYIHVLR